MKMVENIIVIIVNIILFLLLVFFVNEYADMVLIVSSVSFSFKVINSYFA